MTGWERIEMILDRICAWLDHPWWFCHDVFGRYVAWALDSGRIPWEPTPNHDDDERQ
jgi:hypothetical protein